MIRNCAVPYGITTENELNISSTDQKNLLYFFETVYTPNVFWVDMKKMDFRDNAPVKKLKLDNRETYNGESSGHFVNSKPFEFLGLSGTH